MKPWPKWTIWIELAGWATVAFLVALACSGCVTTESRKHVLAYYKADFELLSSVSSVIPYGINGSSTFNMAQEENMPVFEFHDCLGNTVGRYKQDPQIYGTEILVDPGTNANCGMVHVRKTNIAIDAQNP
jgi:hypothetical protein